MSATIINLNDCIYLRDTIQRKKDLIQSYIKIAHSELTLGDLYNMAIDIQRLEKKLKLLIIQKREL